MSESNHQKTEQQPNKRGGKRAAEKTKAPADKALVLRRVYIGLTVVSAIIVVLFLAWKIFAAAPDVNKGPDGENVTRPPQTTTIIDEETGEEIEVEIPGLSTDRKDGFYTFLLIGQSQETGGSLTDTMMLAAYDTVNQALSVMSLPRDTYVMRNGSRVLLNSIFTRAGGDKEGKGAAALQAEVAKLTGVTPDFYVVIQWEAFGELVDAIGGVYYEVPRDMDYDDPTQNLHIHIKKGYQPLDGEKAMGVVRFREGANGYVDGDLGRIRTQQGFMTELVKKCLQPGVILTNLTEYIDIFQRNVTTDLTAGNLAYFAQKAVGGLKMDNVSFVTLPTKGAGDAHLVAIPSQIVELVNESFNPYKEDIQLRELDTVTSIPKPTPKPSQAPAVSETPAVSEAPAESESPAPAESGGPVLPPESSSGAGETTPSSPPASEAPAETPAQPETPPPAETQEVPVFTPPPIPAQSDEPLLPPGV